jgi:hypothetical protein
MSEPWTAGPWMCEPPEAEEVGIVRTADRDVAIGQAFVDTVAARALGADAEGDYMAGVNEAYANARLIAAAPEMAELLTKWSDDSCPACGHWRVYNGCTAEWHDLHGPTVALLSRIRGEA